MGLRHRGVHVMGVREGSHRVNSYPGGRRRKTIPRSFFPPERQVERRNNFDGQVKKTTISLGHMPILGFEHTEEGSTVF